MKIAQMVNCLVLAGLPAAALDVIPTPRSVEPLNRQVSIAGAIKVYAARPGLAMARQMLMLSWPQAKFVDAAPG